MTSVGFSPIAPAWCAPKTSESAPKQKDKVGLPSIEDGERNGQGAAVAGLVANYNNKADEAIALKQEGKERLPSVADDLRNFEANSLTVYLSQEEIAQIELFARISMSISNGEPASEIKKGAALKANPNKAKEPDASIEGAK
jgi:hypothetical protein